MINIPEIIFIQITEEGNKEPRLRSHQAQNRGKTDHIDKYDSELSEHDQLESVRSVVSSRTSRLTVDHNILILNYLSYLVAKESPSPHCDKG